MGKVAMVTGASRGLGATVAEFLAGAGYDLILTARRESYLASAAALLDRYGTTVRWLAGDIADPWHRDRLVRLAEELERLDLLFNNASDLGVTPLPSLARYPLDRLERVFGVNVVAPLALLQEALPLLRANEGLVVNVTSDAAVGGYPGWGGYGASKAALELLTLTLANELGPQGVAVVAVDPGDLRTDMHQAAFPGEDISDRPLPYTTLPFWAWLIGQPHASINGRRFQAQAEAWEVVA